MNTCRLLASVALLSAIVPGSPLWAAVPVLLNYQGRAVVNGTNYDGTGQFKFALVDPGTNTSRQAAATAHLTGQFVTSVDVVDGGAGYVSVPSVAFSGGGGSNATAYALLGVGTVTGIVVTGAGSGYLTPPEVLIDPPPALFSFATCWSNGTGAVSVPVSKGLYSVLLGDTNLPNMAALAPSVFDNGNLRLRVWLNAGSGFEQLMPDQRLTAAPYALSILGAQGAGLTDTNTLFISPAAPAGGDGTMARPWNSIYALTNNASEQLNGKTVLLLPGLYVTDSSIQFATTCTNLTVKGLDPQNVRIVSTNNLARIFTCMDGSTNIVLESLSMTSTSILSYGGAIYCQPGTVVKNCNFAGCSAGLGGAVYNLGGRVQNSTFSGCSASDGGAVACGQAGLVEDCAFSGCSATEFGGAVFCANYSTIKDCLITGCSAPHGGAVYCNYSGYVLNCTFSGNSATNGGAIFMSSDASVQFSSFLDSSAVYGGAVYCSYGGTAQHCTFTRNSASSSGGGVYCNYGGTIENCSIVRGTGTVNSVTTVGGAAKWLSVWTNNISANDYVIYSTSLNN